MAHLLDLFRGRTMIFLGPEVLDRFLCMRVPGDGSCFYSSVACGLMADSEPTLGDCLLGGRLLRRKLARRFRTLEAQARLVQLGEDPEAFCLGVRHHAMADEPVLAETARMLRRPVLVLEEHQEGLKAYVTGTGPLPLFLRRTGEHYDALLPRRVQDPKRCLSASGKL
jgi:hypothetical protein